MVYFPVTKVSGTLESAQNNGHYAFQADAFTHRLLHTDAFAHRGFYLQGLLHTDAFTQRDF